MAFESIAEDLDKIEKLLAVGESPAAIARHLGTPEKAQTIRRYKAQIFDLNHAAVEAWEEEKKRPQSERFEEGKARIIDDLEGLNLAKLRGVQLLELEIGAPYKTAGDDTEKALSLGSASVYWDMGTKILTQAVKQSREIAGDDPKSRIADSMRDYTDDQLRALIAATEEED